MKYYKLITVCPKDIFACIENRYEHYMTIYLPYHRVFCSKSNLVCI